MLALAPRRVVGLAAFGLFIGTIIAANWAIARFGFVPVGFGLVAPAGVYFIGLAFTCRDIVQNTLGRLFSLGAIAVGAAVSAAITPRFALASGLAALLGELADFAVYTPLYRRGWVRSLIPANIAGLLVDSAVFLWLAFGSLQFIEGQALGKFWMTAAAVLVLYPTRRAYALRPSAA